MILRVRRRFNFLLALLLLTAPGCGSKPQIVLAEVTGIVKLDGVPMPDAVVEFLPNPDRDTHGPRSTGTTDAEGRFRLVCDNQRNGAVVGFHRVLIQDARSFPPPRGRDGKPPVSLPSRVPERYRRTTNTPLEQEVTPEPQTIILDVTTR